MTAVEWMISKLPMVNDNDPYLAELIEQAKEMEKQQLKSEQIAKEHFRKQRDESLLENFDKKYSEKEVRGLLIKFHNQCPDRWEIDEWFNQNKKK
jgi:hypothetical protein